MASFARACLASSRLAGRSAAARSFRTSAAAPAAQNFMMPALSPTMTEGRIASWKVKEGDKFSAGDVLLEIETDKATMDVEAQDDGIVAKIMQPEGSNVLAVGSRIAVFAEEGDDLASLEIPADESPKPAAASEPAPAPKTETTKPQPRPSGSKAPKQTYPLLPSVEHLMKAHGVPESAIEDMTATGPNGRLLKGDVLAYLGKINASTPSDISALFVKNSHLDLSNIKVAKASEPAKKGGEDKKKAVATPPPPPVTVPVSLNISFEQAIKAQKKFYDTLGVWHPLSAFITRALDFANAQLPVPKGAQPSADELFDQILGLEKASGPRLSHGSYLPHISGLGPVPGSSSSPSPAKPKTAKKSDIIDLLAASAPRAAKASKTPAFTGISPGLNAFSLAVPKEETYRAQVFLERVKTALETEPQRLVL